MIKSRPDPEGEPRLLTTRKMLVEVPPMNVLSERGQSCAFAVSSNDVPPVVKKSD